MKSRPTGRVVTVSVCLLLAAITFFAFARTLGHGFINFDDQIYVYKNPRVTAGLSLANLAWAFTHTVCANWHPLTVLSHMLDCTLYGLSAGGHHFTNVLLHSLAVVLLFLVLRDMTGAFWRCAFVAAVFAIHPLRVESVAWIAERKDVLSGLFFVLTLSAYTRYARIPSWKNYLAVFAALALGLLAKPMLVTVPFVLLLLDWWPLERFHRIGSNWRWLVTEKIPLLLLAVGSSIATVIAQEKTIAAMERLPMSARLGNAVLATNIYLRQMFWPSDLAILYPHPSTTLAVWKIFLSLAVLAAISVAAIAWRKRHPYLMTGWLWYLGMLVPVIGIVQVGLQSHADRYTYLPQIGLYVIVAWGVSEISRAWPQRGVILAATAAIVVGFLICRTWIQSGYWNDTFNLWSHAIAVTNKNDAAEEAVSSELLKEGQLDEAIAHTQAALRINPGISHSHARLGVAYFRQGRLDEALEEFRRTAAINPNYPGLHYNMATALLEKGRLTEAIAEYRRQLELPPDVSRVRNDFESAMAVEGGEVDDALLHSNLGTALARTGALDEALEHFELALAKNPRLPKLNYNIAAVLLQKRQIDDAIVYLQRELEVQPRFGPAHSDLGVALSQQGRMTEAIEEWQRALQVDPDNINAQSNLAWLYATSTDAGVRDGARALGLAQRAVELSGRKDPRILRLLGAAYAETGRFEDAVSAAREGLALANAQGNRALAASLESNIAVYQEKKTLRDAH